jgi:hypothetical protein
MYHMPLDENLPVKENNIMSKHTPGPWTISKPMGPGNIGIQSKDINAGGNWFVAELPNCPHEEAEGNAELIAAAPELLEAVQNLVLIFQTGNHYDTRNPYTRPEVIEAMKTIAKATGFTGDWTSANDEKLYEYNTRGEATP